jgi:hypothetical protein
LSSRNLKAAIDFPGQKTMLILRIKKAASEHGMVQWRSFSLTSTNYTV